MPLIGQFALALALRVTVCSIGVDGIFVAGSSVFPTTGHANPTLMIVALAIHLADWLKARQFC
jgi:choline dehydrogenase-like flavoprotein